MTDVIDDYVATVGRGLHGSGRLRADMLVEIRDALEDATEAHRDGGAADDQARRLAVDEFGSARSISAALQDVLAVAHGRRTAWTLLAVLGVQHAVSEYLGRSGAWQRSWAGITPGPFYTALARFTDVSVILALAAAAAAVVAFGWGVRRLGVRRDLVRMTAVLASVVIGLNWLSGALLTLLAPDGGTLDGAVAGLVGSMWTVVPSAAVLFSARRAWRAAIS
jgi:hypothetical protein